MHAYALHGAVEQVSFAHEQVLQHSANGRCLQFQAEHIMPMGADRIKMKFHPAEGLPPLEDSKFRVSAELDAAGASSAVPRRQAFNRKAVQVRQALRLSPVDCTLS